MKTELNPTGCPHAIYHFTRGAANPRIGTPSGGIKGIPSIKCLCGEELQGEEAVREHYEIMNAWLVEHGYPIRPIK